MPLDPQTIINGAALVGGWAGIGEGRQDQRQIDQQKRLNDVNMRTAKELADYEQSLKMKMWHDTNYSAQLAEAAKAGVSKAAVLGGNGSGATAQGASIGNVGGGNAADAAAAQNAATNQAMSIAQINNLNADTKLKEANANYTGGAQTENTNQDIANKEANLKLILAQTNNEQLKTIGQSVENRINEVKADIAESTQGDQEHIIRLGVSKIGKEIQLMINENEKDKVDIAVKQRTKEGIINYANKQYDGLMADIILKESQGAVNKAKVDEIVNGIAQKWQELNQSNTKNTWEHVDRNKAIEEYTKNALKVAGIHAIGNIAGDVARIATRRMPKTDRNTQSYDAEGNLRHESQTTTR